MSIGLSIGLAIFPADGTTAESLLTNADLALYAAKNEGRQRWRRLDAALLSEAALVRDIERDLPVALAEESLQVFYQPQVGVRDRTVIGFEALLRWRHPVHGWVSPPMIVAAARRIHKSEALTEFVFRQACAQIARLNGLGAPDALVAVNVSPTELDLYDLPGLVRRLLDCYRVDPRRLEVEITEEAFVGSAKALAALEALSAIGVRIAIDDFGIGCSALSYLRSMRVDRIKIDRSFVGGLLNRAGDRILVQAILGIGQSFGIEVLAEGAENIEEIDLLKILGCGAVQGYYFGKPMAHTDLEVWMATHAERTLPSRQTHQRLSFGAELLMQAS